MPEEQVTSSPMQAPEDLPQDSLASYIPSHSNGSSPLKEADASLTMWSTGSASSRRGDNSSSSEFALPENPPSFLFRRMIGMGGFGEVWESVQASLGRVVAVKRLRPDMLDGQDMTDGKRRQLEIAFRQEALTAAALEHPNIVPVHDLGIDEAGQLLLAMKRLRGTAWDQLLFDDFHKLPPDEYYAKHIPILIDVAQAVAFAHSRGVVHRDIKPSQVMVGEFGEVYLLDWGLAVLFDPEGVSTYDLVSRALPAPTCETATSPAGTAAYMAPEQTEQSARNIGPWTDIFLLGGSLYKLLTGTAPYQTENAQLAFYQASLCEWEPPGKRTPDRYMPSDLVELCRQSMERKREDRLSSAMEFAKALRDHLTGVGRRKESVRLMHEAEGIIAAIEEAGEEQLIRALGPLEKSVERWPENMPARALLNAASARLLLLRRRRQSLLRAAFGFCALVLLVISWGYTMEARRLQQNAELSRDTALRAADTMVEKVASGLERLIGTQTDAVAEIVTSADSVYADVIELGGGGEEVSLGRAKALVSLAISYSLLGDVAGAERKAALAIETLGHINEGSPLRMRADDLLSTTHEILGKSAMDRQQVKESAEHYQEALRLVEKVSPGPNEAATYLSRRARYVREYAKALFMMRDTEGGLKAFEDASELLAEAGRADPSNLDLQVEHASLLIDTSMVKSIRGDLEGELADTVRAAEALERVIAERPGDKVAVRQYHGALGRIGGAYKALGRPEEALATHRKSLEGLKVLQSLDPVSVDLRESVAVCRNMIGRLLLEQKKFEEGLVEAAAAVDTLAELWEGARDNVTYGNSYAFALLNKADCLKALERDEEAAEAAERAVGVTQAMLDSTPDSQMRLFRHTHTLYSAGRIINHGSDPPSVRAGELFEEALEQAQLLHEKFGPTKQNTMLLQDVEEQIRKRQESRVGAR